MKDKDTKLLEEAYEKTQPQPDHMIIFKRKEGDPHKVIQIPIWSKVLNDEEYIATTRVDGELIKGSNFDDLAYKVQELLGIDADYVIEVL